MTRIYPVDDRGRIWAVEDLLPWDQAKELVTTDWPGLAWIPSPGQESWARRLIQDPATHKLAGYISDQLPTINQALGTQFRSCGGQFWLDLPGFCVDPHTDGHLDTAMQLYWSVPGPEWGTGFYRYKNRDSLMYQFQSRPNSGYIVLNHLEQDGSQPLQWHGMFNPVPAGSIRVSSYWQFHR